MLTRLFRKETGEGHVGNDSDPLVARPDLPPPWPVAKLIVLLSLVLCAFQLYAAGIEPLGLFYQRSIHLALIMMVAFLVFPAFGPKRKRGLLGWAIDVVFFCGAIVTGGYLAIYLDEIFARAGFWSQTDIIVGIIAVVTLLEASRRVVGTAITVIGLIFILYALSGPRGDLPWLGQFLPGILAHRGYDIDRLVAQLYLGQEGIFGLPLGVAATYVFVFVLFGAVLEVTGAGKFFIDMAYAATGTRRGGPAKAAIIASAGMGSISGSAIANVVTTGPFTIPLMKKLGFRPAQAGGIEAAASTGGQITPPLMGAGAFLMAEYTGLPYIEIVKISIFPAIAYFVTVYLFVHVIAMKLDLRGLPKSELPSVGGVMKEGWHFVLPLVILIYLLVLGLSPMRVGFWAVISIIGVALARYVLDWITGSHDDAATGGSGRHAPSTALRTGVGKTIEACEVGVRNAVTVSIACAMAGIIVGVIGLTGLGLKFSSLMLAFSGGNIVLALLMVLIASLVLGLGLPVTASYIVLVILVGPALHTEFGIPILIAHMVVFWYSQDSNVTPPVALAAFAGAAVAGSKPMETSVQAWKFAKGLYIIPLFMVFNPEIITGGPIELVVWNGFTALITLAAFVAVLEGYLFGPMPLIGRALLLAGGIGCLYPDIWAEIAGAGAIVTVLGLNWLMARRHGTVVQA